MGCASPKPSAPTSTTSGLDRGHWTLIIARKGGKVVTLPLAPRTAHASDLGADERANGPLFVTPGGRRLDRHHAGRIVRRTACRAGIVKTVTPHTLWHAFITAAQMGRIASGASFGRSRGHALPAGAACGTIALPNALAPTRPR
jgi:integrase